MTDPNNDRAEQNIRGWQLAAENARRAAEQAQAQYEAAEEALAQRNTEFEALERQFDELNNADTSRMPPPRIDHNLPRRSIPGAQPQRSAAEAAAELDELVNSYPDATSLARAILGG